MELRIPNSWHEVTLEKWSELKRVEPSLSELSKKIEWISILTDTDSEDIRKLSINDFKRLSEHLSWMGEGIPTEIKKSFIIDGIEYGLIPDLNYITTGEYLDIENLKDNSEANIHLISAVLWRKIVSREGDEYKIEEHRSTGFSRRAELFKKKLPITAVWGAMVFFSIGAINCLEIIAEYFNNEK